MNLIYSLSLIGEVFNCQMYRILVIINGTLVIEKREIE